MNDIVTAEVARNDLEYDPASGKILWKTNGKARTVGACAGTKTARGYIKIHYKYKQYWAHRLAWLLYYGDWPTKTIDHINGVKSDNRISNLRDISLASNNRSIVSLNSNNSSGFRGVYFHSGYSKWCAAISIDGKKTHICSFSTKEAAASSYLAAKLHYHPECLERLAS